MVTTTLRDIETRYNITHLDHLDRDVAIPAISTLGLQGDVAIIRTDDMSASTPIPADGYPVVRGESGGNTHLLIGDGYYNPKPTSSPQDLTLGTLTVPEGGTTLLSHPEHGGLLIAPGSYELRRQREMADEIRRVAD